MDDKEARKRGLFSRVRIWVRLELRSIDRLIKGARYKAHDLRTESHDQAKGNERTQRPPNPKRAEELQAESEEFYDAAHDLKEARDRAFKRTDQGTQETPPHDDSVE